MLRRTLLIPKLASHAMCSGTGTIGKSIRVQDDSWRKIASLTTPLPVKYFFSTLPPALMTERHFALAENVAYHCQTNQGSLVISFRSEISIRPMHLFDRNRDHDYYFELLV